MSERKIAWEILIGVYLEDKYANLSLRQLKETYSEQSQSFISALVYGTLENGRYLRYQWQSYVNKQPDEELAILLDMSVYQLFFMNTPSYAVINEANQLAKQYKKGYGASFVNAILRKVEANGRKEVDVTDREEKIAIENSYPTWLVKMWKAHYGIEVTEKLCTYQKLKNKQSLRVNRLKITKEELLKLDNRFMALNTPDALSFEGAIVREKWFKEGYVFVQDENSQKVAWFSDVQPGMRVLDCCAAPGTKTIQLAAIMENKGEIIACDIYPQRVELIKEAIEKAGTDIITPVVYDARKLYECYDKESFDLVFLDAPCSGLGVLQHKSDIRQRMKPEMIDDIVVLQKELLDSNSSMVKVNGILVYSTCTLNKKENERQIQTFLKNHPQFILIEEVTCFPFENGGDGFYMAKCLRIE